jgi:hypothetical protein
MWSNPFAFSTFAAISELIVTTLVLYVIIENLRGGPFRAGLLFGTLTFEVFVNVAYMINRSVVVATNNPNPLAHWVGLLGAFHGVLSLVMLIGLIVISVMAYRASKQGASFFRERRGLTHAFLVLWLISVTSGEVLYFAVWF